ncbi:MAG: LexA family transcriptional repressor [Candidatus Magasanikbacteria bacterium CG11_big_fil_rev_8_21_14_0_20_39_34]|uniref:LexA family transcriptional repressor n=1 Tax=Candidatus Magasanikbacteria bacterium CG11_big_fil_rev_8_21_14_0_20_39_34 TaxID=1974653 RepID=A0A2H0N4Q9_9BACT|nr:MAG: LexA family transcriptional repressor [Candidatus Magasanikbacteria bacterium CG11_big_fil_rev_8_21_14_0_20_39_34]
MSTKLYDNRKNKLVGFYKQYKRIPTYEEMVEIFGVKSKGSLHKYVKKFVDDELLAQSESGKLIPTPKLYGLRVLGSIQAGFPTTVEEEVSDALSLDEFLISNPEATYMLTVSGDSMIDAGIVQGDMVVVDRSQTPKNGDIVVANVDNEWTLKYFMERNGTVFLRAANKRYGDIHPRDELTIGGVVTSVIRKY